MIEIVVYIMIKLLTAETSHGRGGARAIETQLDVAGEVVAVGHSAGLTTHAGCGQVQRGSHHQLNLAERAARRNYGTAHILQKAPTGGGDRRESYSVSRANIGPLRRRESAAVHAGVRASGGGLRASEDKAG